MANQKSKINEKIIRFLEEFKKIAPLERAILFGSYASGHAKKWSDIDLALVSSGFEGKDHFQRLVLLGKLAWKAKTTEVEALGFTPQEYKKSNRFDIINEIKTNGITVYPK